MLHQTDDNGPIKNIFTEFSVRSVGRMDASNSIVLRDYQTAAVRNAMARVKAHGSALVLAPTGAGKTVIMGALINSMAAGKRVLVLQHLVNLVDQNSKSIAAQCMGRRVATMANGSTGTGIAPNDAAVVVGTVQTVRGAVGSMARFDFLFLDEAHHAVTPAYAVVIKQLKLRNPRLMIVGFTATPERADGKGLASLFGDAPAHVIQLATLIDAGSLVRPLPPLTLALRVDLVDLMGSDDENDDKAAELINRPVARSEVVRLWRLHAAGRRTIAFCCNVKHAEDLAAEFIAQGVDAVHVSHKTPKGKLRKILADARLGTGHTVICNAMMLTEGFDAPPVSPSCARSATSPR